MTRYLLFWAIFAAFGLGAASAQEAQKQKPPAQQQEQEPPEEDASLKPKEYAFNPLQAQNELRVGTFYFHQKKYKAAANRFREATRWDPSLAEAFFRLGEATEKLNDKKGAKEAYAKYLELAPDGKDAGVARKKIGSK